MLIVRAYGITMTEYSAASHLSKGDNNVVYECHDVLSDGGVIQERCLPMACFQYCLTHQLGTLNYYTLTDVGLTDKKRRSELQSKQVAILCLSVEMFDEALLSLHDIYTEKG